MQGAPAAEPCPRAKKAEVHPSNPLVAAARRHSEGRRALADDYDVTGSPLGAGMSGTVLLARGHLDGRSYAVKRVCTEGLSAQRMTFLRREVEICMAVDHPFIAKLVDLYETPRQLDLVMECCAGGELFQRVLSKGRLAERSAAVATRQILQAVGYLHASHNIVHRDLKPENLLLESSAEGAPVKLIDFGMSRVWSPGMPKMVSTCGSLAYVSPDVLRQQGYTSKSDMWSVGVIVFILLSGRMPFSGEPADMKEVILAGKVNWRKAIWCHLSEGARDFTKALLDLDPERRPDAGMALAHPWLARLAAHEVPKLSEQVVLSMRQYAGAPRLRRVALQLLARELLPEESQELSRLFLGLDRSGSGTVSVGELAAALRELRRDRMAARVGPGGSPRSTSKRPADQSPSSASTADTDLPAPSVTSLSSLATEGSDFEEWASQRSTGSVAPMDADLAEATELFQVLDTNGDGELYVSDFIAAALGSQPRLSKQAVQRVFARLDADRSGSVGTEDLRRALGGPSEDMQPGALLASAGIPLDAHGEASRGAFAMLLGARSGGAAAALASAVQAPSLSHLKHYWRELARRAKAGWLGSGRGAHSVTTCSAVLSGWALAKCAHADRASIAC